MLGLGTQLKDSSQLDSIGVFKSIIFNPLHSELLVLFVTFCLFQ